MIRKAIIPVAGKGTRMYPASISVPKCMLPVGDRPAIDHILCEAYSAGIKSVLIVVSPEHYQVVSDYTKRTFGKLIDLNFWTQGQAKGLGHAILCGSDWVSEPFAVMLGDDLVYSDEPVITQLSSIADAVGGSVVGVKRVPRTERGLYGMVRGSLQAWGLVDVSDMVEKPTDREYSTDYAVMGRYLLEPGIFEYLRYTEPGINGEIQLTDALRMMAAERQVWAYEFEGTRYDVGNRAGYAKACVDYWLRTETGDILLQHITAKGVR